MIGDTLMGKSVKGNGTIQISSVQYKGYLYKPLIYFILYIITTLSISFFGPRIYVDYHKLLVFIYIISFLILFSVGYKLGSNAPANPTTIVDDISNTLQIISLVKVCVIISFLTVIFHFLTALAAGKISLDFASIGQNYIDFYEEQRSYEGHNTVAQIINFLSGFPRLVTMVFGMYYFRVLPRIYKFAIIVFLALWIITNTFSYGNQKSIGDIVICAAVILMIKMLDLSPIKRRNIFVLTIGLVGLCGILFSIIQYQRLDAAGAIWSIDQRLNWRAGYDWNHAIFRLLGFDAGLAFASLLTGYLAGGYYGLSLCFQMPFVWTFGIGNSYSLMAFLDRFMGIDFILDRTYLLRMQNEMGWNGLMAWNTVFPWLASDFTFIGALLVFIPIAYVYAICWKEILTYRNPISILMFSMLTIGLIFVPANNQLLHGVDGFITTVIVVTLWVRTHKKYNYLEMSR